MTVKIPIADTSQTCDFLVPFFDFKIWIILWGISFLDCWKCLRSISSKVWRGGQSWNTEKTYTYRISKVKIFCTQMSQYFAILWPNIFSITRKTSCPDSKYFQRRLQHCFKTWYWLIKQIVLISSMCYFQYKVCR